MWRLSPAESSPGLQTLHVRARGSGAAEGVVLGRSPDASKVRSGKRSTDGARRGSRASKGGMQTRRRALMRWGAESAPDQVVGTERLLTSRHSGACASYCQINRQVSPTFFGAINRQP